MYSVEQLSRYPFFQLLLRQTPLAALHDSLTGLIARQHILPFIQSLIAEQTSFALSIVDLDNFKSINDNYGHRTGDEMLSRTAAELQRVTGERGVVGRYGGDEFLIVTFGSIDYNGVHAFLDSLYAEGGVFRRDLLIRGRSIFSTATVGCAVYPRDTDSFEGLFALIDKALYRGKSKGRNCFIIYVPEKHAQLEIPALARRSLYDTFIWMAAGFDKGTNIADKLRLAFVPIRDHLRMHRLFYLDAAGQLRDVSDGAALGPVDGPEALVENGLYTTRDLDELAARCPRLAERIGERGFASVLISELSLSGRCFGYLIFCPEAHTSHIWQDHECAAAFFLSRLTAQYLEAQDGKRFAASQV